MFACGAASARETRDKARDEANRRAKGEKHHQNIQQQDKRCPDHGWRELSWCVGRRQGCSCGTAKDPTRCRSTSKGRWTMSSAEVSAACLRSVEMKKTNSYRPASSIALLRLLSTQRG